MPSNTPNKGFYLPDTLEDGWDDNKNKDWQILDQIVQNIPNDGDLTAAINNEFGQSLSPDSDVSFASVDTDQVSSLYYADSHSGAVGGDKINNAIAAADADAEHASVIVSGGPDDLSGYTEAERDNGWLLSESIKVRPGVPIIFVGTYCFLDNAVDDNILTNADHTNRTSDVRVEGIGTPRFNGNAPNQTNSGTTRIGFHFVRVDGITVKGVDVGPSHGWQFCPEDVTDAVFKDITFSADGSTPNQDGINFGGPADNVLIDGVRGIAHDDCISLTAHNHQDVNEFSGGDITNVTIRNVQIEGHGAATIKLLCGDGLQLKNIDISGVRQVSGTTADVVRFGQADFITGRGGTLPTPDEFTNITLRDIHTREAKPILNLQSPVGKVTVEDISSNNNTGTDPANLIFQPARGTGYTVESLTVNSAKFHNTEAGSDVFVLEETVDHLKINDLTVHSARRIITGGGTVNSGSIRDVNAIDAAIFFQHGGTANVSLSDITLVNTSMSGTVPTGVKLDGGVPPVNLLNFSNVSGSVGYHDGGGTGNTVGPAFNDGTGWTSLVDGTAIA